MTTTILLSHFHRKIGPIAFYSYPKNVLSEEISDTITSIMDQPLDSGFFIYSVENLITMNYYFEIPSEIARGNNERLMVSAIFQRQTTPETEQNISILLQEFSEQLQSQENIYTAFYIKEIHSINIDNKDEIIDNYSIVKLWVKELYWAVIEITRERTEEEKIAQLMIKTPIYYTFQKLSEGPLTLEALKEWFVEKFPNHDFPTLINILLEEQLIVINQFGRVEKYVLLLKKATIERIPPDSVIEYFDEIPGLIDLLLPKVQQYFNLYETKTKKELKQDAKILFEITANPKTYNLLSKLREGIIQRDKLPKLVSKSTLDNLIETIDILKDLDIIEELIYNNERYAVLKSDIRITTPFPKYLGKLLPKE